MVSAAAARNRSAEMSAPRRITILGATGSIGASTLSVIADRPEAFVVEAVTANANAAQLAAIARKTGARIAVIADEAAYTELKVALSGSGIAVAAGALAVTEAATRPTDLVVAAIVGAAGLAPTYAAINAGSRVALANKECLVSAGALFMAAATRAGVAILPVDSEHNAIFQILDGKAPSTVERIIVTASGGPFRTWTREQMEKATAVEALRHPNWSMGPKITIDSATLMNKGLELIEAHHLFSQPVEKLGVLIHPQSIVHGLVSFADGYVIAALSPPDMRTPIAHCLAYPNASPGAGRRLDLSAIASLEFSEPDLDRFPALGVAQAALAAGGGATNILSAANEIAVAAFLAGSVGFLEIARIVEQTLDKAAAALTSRSPETIDDAIALDSHGRRLAMELIASSAH